MMLRMPMVDEINKCYFCDEQATHHFSDIIPICDNDQCKIKAVSEELEISADIERDYSLLCSGLLQPEDI